MIVERCTQKVIGSFGDAIANEKKFDALEAKLGNVPQKRRYFVRYGGTPRDSLIWERDWESLAAIEAHQKRIPMQDPEWTDAYNQSLKIFCDFKFELLELLVLP